MTTVYFVRHAQSDYSIKDDLTRPLSEKGLRDRGLIAEFLHNKAIDAVLSSPYKRAIDTVTNFANKAGFQIEIIDAFRERKVDSAWIEDFTAFTERQWSDFSYKLSDGECLAEVQERNVAALNEVLKKYKDKSIVIGTHGTALSTIINYFDRTYGFTDFSAMVHIMPWIVRMDFNDDGCISIEKIDLFNPVTALDFNNCVVRTTNFGVLKAYKFIVVFSRYQDKWLYCRAKERDCYETAGGHIESGETPLYAAKRELYEETGAVKFDIKPAFDYSAHFPNFYNTGQVYFAQIHELGSMPEFEMAEVKLFDSIPDKMRFPTILPSLYDRLQGWINTQNSKNELWDIYDKDRNLTGRTHRRGDPLADGEYHLVVHVWIMNSLGEFLITKRTPNKGFPNMWECTGGSAVAGDDSVAAAVREVKEETGLSVLPECGNCIFTLQRDNDFSDVWLFRQDFSINEVVLQENETCDAKWASRDEIHRMIASGEFIAFHYIDELFQKIDDECAAAIQEMRL